ncbi:hypothetical protein OIDMADRAFT_60182 [Oidiodendron maius Zn]|uniref:Enolase-phosphatase E1 n=1 Tax=Oidiodendron maius (strain Zn) TaxID=913774 RepID=A0A0C3C7Y3_OIDMZ|nr:hypothetical protein OIDMADRAFT_60182 [Oidiodendron maius Zn]
MNADTQAILLDIEGTVCPITFVKDVLFPYALAALPATLSTHWSTPSFQPYLAAFPLEHTTTPDTLLSHITALTAQDSKLPALKSLQGYLFAQGYSSGALQCPLFPDVPPSLHTWHALSIPIMIYSSGSVAAQKLLFEHTTSTPSDLRPLLSDYFDTVNAGPKTEAASYAKIASSRPEIEISKWLFLSDNPKEVKAAKEAGIQSFIVMREGNAPLSDEERAAHRVVASFEEVRILGVGI